MAEYAPDAAASEAERHCAHRNCKNKIYSTREQGPRCILHSNMPDKAAKFDEVLLLMLANRNFNFEGVWFPKGADFKDFHFTANANFANAIFQGEADFGCAMFDGSADFYGAQFNFRATFEASSFSSPADFRRARFATRTQFEEARFIGGADFTSAVFLQDASFREAEFHKGTAFHAKFIGAAQFDRARFFSCASFEGTNFAATAEFSLTEFNDVADFSHCVFGGCADFSYAKFNKNVDFASVTFRDSVQFLAGFLKWNRTIRTFSVHSFVNFQEARFDKPAQVTFQSVFLRPNWFIGIDPREFTFSNVQWYPQKLSEEITQRELRKLPYFYQLLERTCWDLSKNREEDSRYDEASKFRYWAFDLRRRSHCFGLAFWRLDWWYWAASGYGERTIRAFVTLLFIWFGFAGLYTRLDFAHSKPTTAIERQISESQQYVASIRLRFPDAIALSLQILLLESPDPAPVSFRGNMLARLEKLLGPVQAALFALAVRRKFMR